MTQLREAAAKNGELWSIGARDWAELQEQAQLPLYGAVLDVAGVTRGTRVLDVGCGSGLSVLLASLRGASVAGIDAAPALIEIARERVPNADLRVADIEAMPFEDSTFDAVIAINVVFYASDMRVAMRELVRLTHPGGRVVFTSWGPADQSEYSAVSAATRPLAQPPPPGAPAMTALAGPGALEALAEAAGLDPLERGETACTFHFPNADAARAAEASSGNAQRAIAASGVARVHEALDEVNRRYTAPDGSVRFRNTFIWLAARKP